MRFQFSRSKLTSISLISAVALSLASCKKDYTCTCVSTGHNPWTNVITSDSSVTTIHDTKDNAVSQCKDREKTYNHSPNSSVSCAL